MAALTDKITRLKTVLREAYLLATDLELSTFIDDPPPRPAAPAPAPAPPQAELFPQGGTYKKVLRDYATANGKIIRPEKLYTTSEVGAFIGKSGATVGNYADKGAIKYIRNPGPKTYRKFKGQDIIDYIKNR